MTSDEFLRRLQGTTKTRALLQLLADGADVYGPAVRDAFPQPGFRVLQEAEALVERLALGPQISTAQMAELRMWLGFRIAPSPNLATLCLLKALDQLDSFGPRVGALFEGSAPFLVEPGGVFPIAARFLKDLFNDSLVSRPVNQGQPCAAFENFGILRELSPYQVCFDGSAGPVLSQFTDQPIVAAVIPNVDHYSELEIADTRHSERAFFGVRPKDVAAQESRIMSLLERAAEAGARIVLMPELSVTETLSAKIRERVDSSPFLLVAAGSSHRAGAPKGVNLAEAFASASRTRTFQHHKLSQFEMHRWGPQEFEHSLWEDISILPARITLFWANGWSFCLLICKDALDVNATYVIEHLRPNFLFVVAFSERTGGFAGLLKLAAAAQTTVLMANFHGSPTTPEEEAIAALPLRHPRLVAQVRPDPGLPGLLILNLQDHLSGWTEPR